MLDNCEHLADAAGALIEQLGRRCTALRVLATSRERLAVDGEWVRRVDPLSITEVHGDPGAAVQLFLDRAAAVGAAIDPQGHLPTVVEICRILDGLPLAIELAAARTFALPVEELLVSLQDDATDVGERRTGTQRHRDLWAVADWSYRLLDPEEQELFERLSVFAGDFSVAEVHPVCAPTDQARTTTGRQLAALADRSMLTMAGGGVGGYRMLRPLRAFARQRLADRGDPDEIAQRHAAVFTDRAERAAGPPLTDEGRSWLEGALDDLREVRQRAQRRGEANLLGRLIAALYRFDYWRAGGELLGWADEALDVQGMDEEPTASQVYAAAAAAAWRRGDLERARRLAERGVDLRSGADDPTAATVFEAVGDVANFEGRLEEAEAAFREEARLARIGGDPDGEVLGLASAALVLAYAGRIVEGVAEADGITATALRAGPAAHAFARYAQGECRAEVAPEEALLFLTEAVTLAGRCGAPFLEDVARLTETSLRGRHGDPKGALPAFADVIRRWQRSGNWTQQRITLCNLVDLLVRLEADKPAVAIASAIGQVGTGGGAFGTESDRLDRALAIARRRMGDAVFEAARVGDGRAGRADTVALALAAIEEQADLVAPGVNVGAWVARAVAMDKLE
ncbi:hypothetical protein BH23ACT9_BH23ACT9_28710 [soil metagenome]